MLLEFVVDRYWLKSEVDDCCFLVGAVLLSSFRMSVVGGKLGWT